MTTKEEVLVKQTYKEDGIDVGQRVYYTLMGEQNTPKREQLQAHRISRAVGSLFKLLREKHLISEKALDEILFDALL